MKDRGASSRRVGEDRPAGGATVRLLGQTHMRPDRKPLLAKITGDAIEPFFVMTHELSLADAADVYRRLRDKESGCAPEAQG